MEKKAEIKQTGDNYTVIVPTKTKEITKIVDSDEVTELKVLESIECKVKIDFKTLKKAHAAMVKLDPSTGGTTIDLAGAGEQILMFGWIEGNEEIRTNPMYKMSACLSLANIVSEFPVSELKKNLK